MSTFDGFIHEFPHIAIDHFRTSVRPSPPLACFLSHVHSDHLHGLESLRSPFVFCSPATKEILLRLVKYPHRINFAKGILETREQTYKHLNKLLKTIPLETPTVIELNPGNDIRVTLFDANHCVGAVMFLIQGQGKAILCTGDVRAESWWVNSIVRNPSLIPYTLGNNRLDKIYLDTTFASTSWMYREFPTKADGLKELLEKVSEYPPDTTFHFNAWTFGYEDVWIALAAYLNTPIHLDDYRWGLYRSLATIDGSLPQAPEAAPLVGFHLGNHGRDGCLTPSPNVRLHSCERGTGCPEIDGGGATNVVRIFPIVKRLPDGAEVAEMGLGGGKGDLDQTHELETPDPSILGRLQEFLSREVDDALVARIMESLNVKKGNGRLRLDAGLDLVQDEAASLDGIPLQRLVNILARLVRDDEEQPTLKTVDDVSAAAEDPNNLPRIITFPYARHASYAELCDLVGAFKPKDLHPCTVDPSTWTPRVGMKELFGHLCSGNVFAHDAFMMALPEVRERLDADSADGETQTQRTANASHRSEDDDDDTTMLDAALELSELNQRPREQTPCHAGASSENSISMSDSVIDSAPLILDTYKSSRRSSSRIDPADLGIPEWAERAAKQVDGFTWSDFGGLVSTRKGPEEPEVEL
ncbi:putative DNA repair protein [Phyllosticta capitalensis]